LERGGLRKTSAESENESQDERERGREGPTKIGEAELLIMGVTT